MKLSAVIILALQVPILAFAPSSRVGSSRWVVMSGENTDIVSRRNALAVGGLGLAPLVLGTKSASAGWLAGSPEVLDPKSGTIDSEILASSSVQDSLKNVRRYQDIVKQMEQAMIQNDQVDLGPAVRESFDFSKIRFALNNVNSALDEDTQRGTDRLIRGVIQDLAELENANLVKPGNPRSARKVEILNRKLSKLCKSFDDYLKFFV